MIRLFNCLYCSTRVMGIVEQTANGLLIFCEYPSDSERVFSGALRELRCFFHKRAGRMIRIFVVYSGKKRWKSPVELL